MIITYTIIAVTRQGVNIQVTIQSNAADQAIATVILPLAQAVNAYVGRTVTGDYQFV